MFNCFKWIPNHANDRFSANKKLAKKEQIDTIDTTNPGNDDGNGRGNVGGVGC